MGGDTGRHLCDDVQIILEHIDDCACIISFLPALPFFSASLLCSPLLSLWRRPTPFAATAENFVLFLNLFPYLPASSSAGLICVRTFGHCLCMVRQAEWWENLLAGWKHYISPFGPIFFSYLIRSVDGMHAGVTWRRALLDARRATAACNQRGE